jgi:hypothetical protein
MHKYYDPYFCNAIGKKKDAKTNGVLPFAFASSLKGLPF